MKTDVVSILSLTSKICFYGMFWKINIFVFLYWRIHMFFIDVSDSCASITLSRGGFERRWDISEPGYHILSSIVMFALFVQRVNVTCGMHMSWVYGTCLSNPRKTNDIRLALLRKHIHNIWFQRLCRRSQCKRNY